MSSFVIPLPPPHDSIRLTRPRLEDAEKLLPILNDPAVYVWMGAGLPIPHELYHAQRWLQSVIPSCDIGQQDVEESRALTNGVQVTPRQSSGPIRECPVRILREYDKGEELFLGDLGLTRWRFEDITDKEERQRLITENQSKLPGDPTIIWSIGYYLRPSHHGRGIMKAAIHTLLAWVTENMHVKHLRTSAIEGNGPSLKALTSNGFRVEKVLPEFAWKEGKKTGLVILELKYL